MYVVCWGSVNRCDASQGSRGRLTQVRPHRDRLFLHLLSMRCTSFLRWKPGIGCAGTPGRSTPGRASGSGVSDPPMMNSPEAGNGAEGLSVNWAGMGRELGMTDFRQDGIRQDGPRMAVPGKGDDRKPRTGTGDGAGSAGYRRCADFLVETEDEGGIGQAGKGSAEHGIHDLHLHSVE